MIIDGKYYKVDPMCSDQSKMTVLGIRLLEGADEDDLKYISSVFPDFEENIDLFTGRMVLMHISEDSYRITSIMSKDVFRMYKWVN
jgi:hypothetical protein